jgi:hypothetical protein
MTCKGCSALIDLKSVENTLLISETEAHCTRIEVALKKQSKVPNREKRNQGKSQRSEQKVTPARMPMASRKKDNGAMHLQAR